MRALIPSLLALFVLQGCAKLTPPTGFLEVESSRRELKAVAADESLYWTRTFDVPKGSDLAFWSEALENELVAERGHVVLDKKKTTVGGAEAIELTIEGSFGGEAKRYWMLFFLEPGGQSKVRTVEYIADKVAFDKHLAAVRVAAGVGS